MRYAIPAGVFVLLLVVLAIGLKLDPRHVPSPLVGKPLPEFSLPALDDENADITAATFSGKPKLLNVWASWCVACRIEHPLLIELAKTNTVAIVGLNYKDERADALGWLARHGNPYTQSVFDHAGRLGLDLGVYGVPETFVIDRHGVIRHKHIGPITNEVKSQILDLIDDLAHES